MDNVAHVTITRHTMRSLLMARHVENKDKYEMANEIYAQLTQQGIIGPEKI